MKKIDIAVGIPSYNEMEKIFRVVRNVDEGLEKYFDKEKAIIINTDSYSTDDTKKIFLDTPTLSFKKYISTPLKKRGKGSGVLNFFKEMDRLGAKAGMITDADIKSGTPEWVKCLINPALRGYDLVAPIYHRHKHDGTITNHICFPLVYGLYGKKIRQPIGGEFGFSKRLIKYLLKQKWPDSALKFGVDIFLTTKAIEGGFKICQVDLGVKNHNPSLPKLKKMSLEVTETLFKNIVKSKKMWLKKIKKDSVPKICKTGQKINYSKFKIDIKKVSKHEDIDMKSWTKIVYDTIYKYDKSGNNKKVLKNFIPLYLARSKTFIKETETMSQERAEKEIIKQAEHFYKHRNYLLKKYEKIIDKSGVQFFHRFGMSLNEKFSGGNLFAHKNIKRAIGLFRVVNINL